VLSLTEDLKTTKFLREMMKIPAEVQEDTLSHREKYCIEKMVERFFKNPLTRAYIMTQTSQRLSRKH